MSYLVIDLQRSSLDTNITTTNLLRKAFAVSKKLKLTDFENWINLELNGYCGSDIEIPKYREVHGELKGYNPYSGWIPTLLDDNELHNIVTSRKINTPISELEYLINDTKDNSLCITLPPEVERSLGIMFDFYTKYQLFINKSQFYGIIEMVRTTIMNWALELECDGILGEEMVFTEKEKQIAVERNYIVNNFYGNVENSQIQQNTNQSKQRR